jgi:CarD family transcriptional regulator
MDTQSSNAADTSADTLDGANAILETGATPRSPEHQYKIGDKVAGRYGVMEVIEIRGKDTYGNKEPFYLFRNLGNGPELSVPVSYATVSGIRPLVSEVDIEQMYTALRVPRKYDFSESFKSCCQRLLQETRSRDFKKLAEAVRELYALKSHRTLSFNERQLFTSIREILAQEIAAVQGREADEVIAEFKTIFENA